MKIYDIFIFFSSLALFISKDIPDNILPSFNLKSGFYNVDSIILEISIEDPDAFIYYTLDGFLQ